MRLGMFHPNDNPLDRGWVGRIDGDRMLHLAAQTLQSFVLVGGGSRVHAEYPLAEVTLLVPVQYYHVPPGHWNKWERTHAPRWREDWGPEWADKRGWKERDRDDHPGKGHGKGHGRGR